MDTLSSLPQATIDALMRDYTLWVAIAAITLAFTLYVYFFPQSIDFFKNPPAAAQDSVKKESKE